jgi:hypothetical protein
MTAKAKTATGCHFQRNGFYERLAELRKTDPRTFASISPASKLALYHYEAKRRQYAQTEKRD